MPFKSKLALWLFIGCVITGLISTSTAPARSSGEPPTPTPLISGVMPPQTLPTGVVLSNADFEAGLAGWQTWHEDTGKPARADSLDYVIEPAFSIERNPALIKSGSASLHVGRIYDPWHAGLKRAVVVTPRSTVRFCMAGRLYASNRDFGREPSWASIDGRMQVGLLVGDGDWTAAAITWSAPVNPHDDWREMCVETGADETGRLTLFTLVNYRGQAAKHLDAWWDAASLSEMVGSVTTVLPAGWPSINAHLTTQPISVLLLIPSTSITAYTVLPAQMFATGQGITLALSAGAALPAASPTNAPLPTPVASVSTLTPTVMPAGPIVTPVTPTLAPPTARPSATPRPAVAATRQATAQPGAERLTTDMPLSEVERAPSGLPVGVGGLVGLLLLGFGGGVYVIRHR